MDRRRVLTGVFAASAVGLTGSAAGALNSAPVEANDVLDRPAPVGTMATELVVTASSLRLSTAGRAAPKPGDSVLLSADLAIDDVADAGSLHGTYLVIGSSGVVGVSAPTSIETHHFVFPEGTLVGTGTASLDGSEDHFVILGGTGVFDGVSGSYAATQHPLGLGGDGSATYRFTIQPQQGS